MFSPTGGSAGLPGRRRPGRAITRRTRRGGVAAQWAGGRPRAGSASARTDGRSRAGVATGCWRGTWWATAASCAQCPSNRSPTRAGSRWRWCLPTGRPWGTSSTADEESFGVQLLDVKSGTRTPQSALRPSNAYYADLAWRPDSAVVASTQNDQWVDLWDGATGQAAGRHRVPDRYGVVETVRFSGDNARLVVGTHQGWVYAVDASTLKVARHASPGEGGRAHARPRRERRRCTRAGVDRPQAPAAGPHAGAGAQDRGSRLLRRVMGVDTRREGHRRGRQHPIPGRLRHGRIPGSGRPVDEVQGVRATHSLGESIQFSPMASGSRPPGTTEWASGT